MNVNTSRCRCLPNYFDNLTAACIRCPSGCSACTSTTYCTYCHPNFYLRPDNLCYTTCLSRFFANADTWTCQACPYDCYDCDGSGNCLTCSPVIDFRVLTHATQRCLPLIGYY